MKIREGRIGFRKFWLVLGVFAVLLFGTALTASAAATMSQKQTNATTTTATVSWNPVSGASYYKFTYWNYEYKTAKTGAVTVTVNDTSYTINCAKDTAYLCDVEAYSSSDEKIDEAYTYQPCSPTPGQLTGYDAESWGSTKGGVFVLKTNPYPNILNGVEWRLLTKNGKTVKYSGTTTSDHIYASSASLGQVYQLSVRGYALVSGTKLYGPWYSKIVVPQPKMKALKLASGSRIKVKWKKVSGATKYIIYGSTKQGSGYKKIATVKKNKSSYTVSKVKGKRLKKYQNYYFKVQAVCGKNKSLKGNYKGGYISTTYR